MILLAPKYLDLQPIPNGHGHGHNSCIVLTMHHQLYFLILSGEKFGNHSPSALLTTWTA